MNQRTNVPALFLFAALMLVGVVPARLAAAAPPPQIKPDLVVAQDGSLTKLTEQLW